MPRNQPSGGRDAVQDDARRVARRVGHRPVDHGDVHLLRGARAVQRQAHV